MLAKLNTSIKQAKPISITDELVHQVQKWAWEHLRDGDDAHRKAFIQECIHDIEVKGSDVNITYALKPLVPQKHDVGFCWLPGLDSNQQPSG